MKPLTVASSVLILASLQFINGVRGEEKREGVTPESHIKTMPGGIQMDKRKEGLDMGQMKRIAVSKLREAVGQMNETQKDALCRGIMRGGADDDMLKRLKEQGADCIGAMRRDPTFTAEGGEAEVAIQRMREEKRPEQWGDSDWSLALRQFADGLKDDDLKAMPAAMTKRMVANGDMEKAKERFKDSAQKRALEKNLKAAYGQPDSWQKKDLEEMVPFLGSMTPETLRQIPAARMREVAGRLKNVSFEDGARKAAIGRKVIEGLGRDRVKDWTAEDVENADPFIRNDRSIIEKISDGVMSEVVEKLGARKTCKKGAIQLAERIKKLDDFKNPAALDSAKLQKLGQLSLGVGRDYLRRVRGEALEGALESLADVPFPRGEAEEIMKKIKGKLSEYTAQNVTRLRNLIIGLKSDDLKAIPDKVIGEAIEELSDKDFDESQCKAIVKKAKTADKGNMKKMGPLMSKCVSPEDLNALTVEDLGLGCDSDKAPSMIPNKAQAKKMFRKIRAKFGLPSSDNTRYALACMKNWGRAAALGMEPAELANLPDNDDLDSVIEVIGEHEADMDDGQTMAMADRLRRHLRMDDPKEAGKHVAATIEKVGKFLKHFGNEDLDKFSDSVKPDIVRKLGESNLDSLPLSEKKRLKDFALKNVKRDDTSRVTDRRKSPVLDDNDVRDLGNLFGGFEGPDIARMDKTAIENNIVVMGDKIRGAAAQMAFWNTVKDKDSAFTLKPENIIGSAGLAGGMTDGVLNSLSESVLGQALADSVPVVERRAARDKKRDDSGYRSEVSDEDRHSLKSQRYKFLVKAFGGFLENKAKSSERRRRSTQAAVTCSDVETLGSAASILSAEQIKSMSSSEFTDCTETLGKASNWKSDALPALAAKAKEAYGEPSTWTADVIRRVGSVGAGLTEKEIGSLDLTSASLLTSMGKSPDFSEGQLRAGFSRLMSRAKSGDAGQLSSEDLAAMGSFACGAQSADIAKIPTGTIRSAASDIGKLEKCGSAQMTAFAEAAKKSFGNPSTWDQSTITSLGDVVAALPESDFKGLSASQISSIPTKSISKIPQKALAGMSGDQLRGLTGSQASALTAGQRGSLDSTKRSIIEARANFRVTGPKPSVEPPTGDPRMQVPDLPNNGELGISGPKRIMPGGFELDSRKESMDMSQLKDMDRQRLGQAVAQMSESDRDVLCQRAIRGGADSTMLRQLKEHGADCVSAMRRDPTFKVEGGQAEMALKQMREEAQPERWDDSKWSLALRQMPSAIRADDIKQMSPDTTRNLVQSGDLKEAAKSFTRPSEMRALETQLKSAFGDPDAWDRSTLESMGPMLGKMDPATLRSITKENARAAASSFRDIEFDDPIRKAAAGKQLVDGLGKSTADRWTAEDITNADQYIRTNPAIVPKLSDTALASCVQDLGARQTDKRGAAQLGKRLKAMDDYKDPTQVDSTKLEKMGQLAKGLGPKYLKQLTASAITGALGTLANVSFPRGEAKELMAKIKGTPSEYTVDRVRELGELILGLESEDLDQVPDSAIGGVIEDLASKDFDVSQCRSIVKKAKSAGKSNMKKLGKLMSKCMSPADLQDSSIDDLGLGCDTDSAPSFEPDKAQAKEIFKKVREMFGPPSSNNTNYTLSCMKNWGRVAALGMEPSDFENLPDNGDLNAIFDALGPHEKDMDDAQTRAIAKRLRRHLNMDDDNAVKQIDSTAVEQFGKFLKHFNDSDLDKFNETVKPDLARKIGEANFENQPRSEKRRLKEFALKNIKRDNTSLVTDRRGAETWDDNDVRDLGNLFEGIEENDIKKLDKTAFENNLATMKDKLRDLPTQRAFWSTVQARDSTFLSNTENIIGAAGLAAGMPSETLQTIGKSVLGEGLSDASAMLEERARKDERRDKSGFRSELSSTDRDAMDTQKKEFVKRSFEGYQESQTSSNKRRRRRRQTVTISCADVQVLGSNVVSLTTTQIDSLSTSDFEDCTETLGTVTGWSSAQLSSLATKAKSTYGSPATWSSSTVKLVGTMCAGLTSSDISTLDLSSASVLTAMGSSTAFSSSQLSAGFARFLSRSRSDAMTAVTGDDLMTIGNFVCGATTSNIAQITQTAFTTAVSSIGQLSTCDSSQLMAFAVLAKTAYGAPTSWDSATITSLGAIIGGLTAEEIGTLTTNQISSISTTSINQISPSSFSGFSVSQISSFSSAQANAVTAAQQSALSTSQREALVGAGATDLTTTTGSGASGLQMSLLALLITAALSLRL